MRAFRAFFLMSFVLWEMPAQVKAAIDTTATWTFKTNGPVYSSPTYDNGSVFIGSDDGYLYRLDASTGAMVWKFQTGGIVRCKPAVVDSVVYFGSDDGNLYAASKRTPVRKFGVSILETIFDRVLPDPSTQTGNYWDYMQSSPCVDSGVSLCRQWRQLVLCCRCAKWYIEVENKDRQHNTFVSMRV